MLGIQIENMSDRKLADFALSFAWRRREGKGGGNFDYNVHLFHRFSMTKIDLLYDRVLKHYILNRYGSLTQTHMK